MAKKILIIKPSALGDVALSLPVLSSLRASFPDAEIAWFVRKEFAPLLECVEGLDEIIIFDRKLLGKWWCDRKAFSSLINLIKLLRKRKFDLVIDLQGLFRAGLFGWLTGSNRRFGMKDVREFADIFYTDKVSTSDCVHLIDCHEKILTAVGASQIRYDFNVTAAPQAKAATEELLAGHGLSGQKYAVFVPGAAHACKCWPGEYFAELGEKISSQFGLKIATVGTGTDKRLIKKIKAHSKVPITDFAGLTDIPSLVALLEGAELVVSNDTGPGHIAAALGRPIVMIFGPTNPGRVGPYKKANTVAAIDEFDRGRIVDSVDAKHSIEGVGVELVFEKVVCQLSDKSKGADL